MKMKTEKQDFQSDKIEVPENVKFKKIDQPVFHELPVK